MDACERISIVGSLRRGKPMVGDFELLVIPHRMVYDRLEEWATNGFIRPRKNIKGNNIAWGEKMRCIEVWDKRTERWLPGDLFFTDHRRWGMTELIRTGDADFSRLIVTRKAQGGALPKHLRYQDWLLWGLDGQPLYTTLERDVFRLYGLPYIHPPNRSAPTLRAWAGWAVKSRGRTYSLADLVEAQTPFGLRVSKYRNEYHWSLHGQEIPPPEGVIEINGVWYGDGVPLRIPADVMGYLEMWRVRHITGRGHLWIGQSTDQSVVHLPAGRDGYAPPMPQRLIMGVRHDDMPGV